MRLRTAILSAFCLALAVEGLGQQIHSWTGKTMGPIEYMVQVVADDEFAVDDVRKRGEVVLSNINGAMSTYLPDSEISRFNRSLDLDWFPVQPKTAEVIQRALDVSRLTEGAFDVTVQPLVQRWSFGPDSVALVLPTETEVQGLLEGVGYQRLEVRMNPPGIKKSVPQLQVDLSAIAKGYAVDQMAEMLMELGIQSFFVDIGGEVRVQGLKPDGSRWRVGIETPMDVGRQVQRVISMDGAVATSGDYRNFVMIDGKRYAHTIDPKTGWPVKNDLASVSVVSEDCMTADAYATAIMVLGREKGSALAQQVGFELMTIERDGAEFKEWSSSAFPFHDITPAATDENSLMRAFLGALVVFLIAVLAMAIGAIFSNKPIQGSCGGIATKTGKDGATACSLCEKPVSDCIENSPLK